MNTNTVSFTDKQLFKPSNDGESESSSDDSASDDDDDDNDNDDDQSDGRGTSCDNNEPDDDGTSCDNKNESDDVNNDNPVAEIHPAADDTFDLDLERPKHVLNAASLPPQLEDFPNGDELDDGTLLSQFINGLGIELVQPRFKAMVESQKSKLAYIDNQRTSGDHVVIRPELTSLPYIWHKLRRARIAYFADCLRVTRALALQLEYKNIFSYLQTRGWLLSSYRDQDGQRKFRLEYRKLKECLELSDNDEINQGTTTRRSHLGAFVDELYKIIHNGSVVNKVTGKPDLEVMDIASFRSKLNQAVQTVYVATSLYYSKIHPCLDASIDEDPQNYEKWLIKIFGPIRTRKDFYEFVNNMFMLAQ